jgi:hypothetical protein
MGVIVKDIVNTIYKELFTIKFLHNSYGFSNKNLLADNIEIEPDDATKNLFKGHRIGFRLLNDLLICFIQAKLQSPVIVEPKLPFIKFLADVRIRFLMSASNDFYSKTDVAISGTKQVYYFTNKVNIATDGFISMHTTGVENDDLKSTDIIKPDKNCFSVIDIFNNGAVNSSYDLYDGVAQKLKSPLYTIRLKNKI